MTAPWRDCRELKKFARKHRLKICTVADLIHYRRTREKLVRTRRSGEDADGLRRF